MVQFCEALYSLTKYEINLLEITKIICIRNMFTMNILNFFSKNIIHKFLKINFFLHLIIKLYLICITKNSRCILYIHDNIILWLNLMNEMLSNQILIDLTVNMRLFECRRIQNITVS